MLFPVVEIHCHGGGGGDFMEGTEEAFRTAINAHETWYYQYFSNIVFFYRTDD